MTGRGGAAETLVVRAGPPVHGGACLARRDDRPDGQVVFVRHALPGERVAAAVTGAGGGGRHLFADAVEVLGASGDRVDPPCPHAGPGRCGGCDWQHAAPGAQRRLKAAVVADQLVRLGGVDAADPVLAGLAALPVPGDAGGLRWRTRVRWAVDADGAAGFRRYRSHEVHAVDDCRIATAAVAAAGVGGRRWPGAAEVAVTASSEGETVVRPLPRAPQGPPAAGRAADREVPRVHERAAGRRWRVAADGFWQVHVGAADALVGAVRAALRPAPGDHLLDLYSGVGLVGGALAGDVGPAGRVDCVERSAAAGRDARRNLHDRPQVRLHTADVAAWTAAAPRRADLVVLDPPRSGAGPQVLRRLARTRPRRLCYVACDAGSLARDAAALAAEGWRLADLRVLDAFPMTAHVECVALFLPPPPGPRAGRTGGARP